MEILTKTVLSLLCLVDIGGNVELHCLNFPFFKQNRESKTVMVNNPTNMNTTKESLNSDGQHFHQYQQNREI
jgi:hypothetical protein